MQVVRGHLVLLKKLKSVYDQQEHLNSIQRVMHWIMSIMMKSQNSGGAQVGRVTYKMSLNLIELYFMS